jgi:hypothetical protein
MARLIREGGRTPSGEKGDKQSAPCKCDKQPAIPNGDKRGGSSSCSTWANMFLQHTDSFFIAHKIQLYILMDWMGPLTPDVFLSDTGSMDSAGSCRQE